MIEIGKDLFELRIKPILEKVSYSVRDLYVGSAIKVANYEYSLRYVVGKFSLILIDILEVISNKVLKLSSFSYKP